MFNSPQLDKYSATLGWLFALAMTIAVFPFFDFILKSAPCKTKYFTQVRWPFLAATCNGVHPEMSASSTSPPCWIRSFSTSRWPLAAALCTAVEPASSNSFALLNTIRNMQYQKPFWRSWLLGEWPWGTPWHLHNDIYKYPHQSTKFLHQKLPSALIPLGQQLNHNYSKLVNNVHLICTAHDGVQDTFLSRGIGKKHRLNNNKKNEYHF